MKKLFAALLLLSTMAFGQNVKANKVATVDLTSTGISIFNVLSAKQQGEVFSCDQFSGAGPAQRINACIIAAKAVNGTADASMFIGTQVMTEQISLGDHAQTVVGLQLPTSGNWLFDIKDGTSCGIKQFGGTSLKAKDTAPVNVGTLGLYPNANDTYMAATYCTEDRPINGGQYIVARDFVANVVSNTAPGARVYVAGRINEAFDHSQWTNIIFRSRAQPTAYGSGGSCTMTPSVGMKVWGGVLQGCFVQDAGANCGTGAGLSWSFGAGAGTGTGGTFTTKWSGGKLNSCTLTNGGSGYAAFQPYGLMVDGACCGSKLEHIQGLVRFGIDEAAFGVRFTSGSNVATYSGITTEDLSRIIGAGIVVSTFENTNPGGGGNSGADIFGSSTTSVSSITATTITFSNPAKFTNAVPTVIEFRISKAADTSVCLGQGCGGAHTTYANSTANKYYQGPGYPNVFIGGSSIALNIENLYLEKNNAYDDSISPAIYVGGRATHVNIKATCVQPGSRTCVYSNSPSVNVINAAGGENSSSPSPWVYDKYYGTKIPGKMITLFPGTSSAGWDKTVAYNNVEQPFTTSQFIPASMGWYRVYDSSLVANGTVGYPMGATIRITSPAQQDVIVDVACASYRTRCSATARNALNANLSGYGSVTKIEVSKQGMAQYIDLYIATASSNRTVTVAFSNSNSLLGEGIVLNPVVGSAPTADTGAAIIDLTNVTQSSATIMSANDGGLVFEDQTGAIKATIDTDGKGVFNGSLQIGASGSTISDTRELIQNAHSCGTTTTCANTANGSNRMIFGQVTLAAGAATVSGITGFTSISSFFCTCTDQSTIPAACSVQNASTSSITIKGTGGDVINYQCVGN
jgi:hypothetical protein